MDGIHDSPLIFPKPQTKPPTPQTMYHLIMPPTRRTNRRRPSATRRTITRAVQVTALLAAAYGLAYAITTAAMA